MTTQYLRRISNQWLNSVDGKIRNIATITLEGFLLYVEEIESQKKEEKRNSKRTR